MPRNTNKYYIIFATLLLLVGIGMWVLLHYQEEAFVLIKESVGWMRDEYAAHPALFLLAYAGSYIGSCLLLIPSDMIFMLIAGAIFGLPLGSAIACTVHSIGTMGMFFTSRRLLKREGMPIETDKQKWNAWFMLLVLRMTPLVPTHGISLMMANAPLTARGFFTATWLGTLPLALLFAYLGQEVAEIHSIRDVMTPQLIGVLIAMASVLVLAKLIYNRMTKN